METKSNDRRATGIRRVDFSTLVEICGREPGTPAFEAEAVELSGRGMQVRTRYLPDENAPLVLRFEHEGKEAVVEGEVAWRHETEQGGEFGIKFTALDGNSVRVLKEVCSLTQPNDDAKGSDANQGESTLTTRGAPVRLHIHGLGAPMRARVFSGGKTKLDVGSQLEFLKVGKALELEDVEGGEKRMAEIDSVSVTVDPRTQIPQLVVSLRYESDDTTPEPSVVGGDSKSDERIQDQHRPSARKTTASASASSSERTDEDDEDDGDDFDDTEALFKGKVATWASGAGETMRATSAHVARATKGITRGIGDILSAATRRASDQRGSKKSQRRTTRAPSSVAVSGRGVERKGQKDLPRAQRSIKNRSDEAPKKWRRGRAWVIGAAALVCVSGAYPLFFAGRDRPSPREAAGGAMSPLPSYPPTAPSVAMSALPTAPGALPVPGTPPAVAFPEPATLDTEQQLEAAAAAVTANVPLFGPQQLATTEPTPLTPPPNTVVDEIGMAKDQTFAQPVLPSLGKTAPANDDTSEESSARAPDSNDEKPSSASDKVWQVGRMQLPIVHRLRLDAPGDALTGTKTPNGFSVLVPGRKVMETGASIAKRDDRILSVNVKNTPAGGQVIFRFRKDIPGYKVRLRNDYVEFFVNSKD